MNHIFKALIVREKDGKFEKKIEELGLQDLPQNEVLIQVSYSSVNYKDALSASGNRGVTRKFPHVPGIDAVGEVVSSRAEGISIGTKVLVTGYDLGMNTWGGFGEYIAVPASWVILLPNGLSEKEAMCFGTAGLTAGLSINRLIEAGIKPKNGKIVVSGATGGVGSLSIAVLNKLGYHTVAISGKSGDPFLTETLGAKEIISRTEFIEKYNSKPLSKTEFAAGIDTVGGDILSGMLKSVQYDGAVTCCGMVASIKLESSIFPFILRGASLLGVDSVEISTQKRHKIWNLLAKEWKPKNLDQIAQEITLEKLSDLIDDMLNGKIKGRYILKHKS